ncbi:MAG: ABC transporter permease [Bacteroidota bacterium]
MLKNYLKIALRNLQKHQGYSFINIFGLALGIASCLLIMLFVLHELSYDRWNENAERIVRPTFDVNFGGNAQHYAVTGGHMGPQVLAEMPEVQNFCRFRDYGSYLIKREGEGQQNFKEEHVLYTDSTFFEVFPVSVIEGDARKCLTQPNSIAIARRSAEKYFGSHQLAIGQTLVLENEEPWKVTAVYENIPGNTHFQADFLLAMSGNRELQNAPRLWAMNNNFHNYLLLRKGTDFEAFNEKFVALSKEKIGITANQLLGMSLEEFEATGQYARVSLQQMTDIHLHSDLWAELAPNGSIQYVYIFSAIALFILLIACINFMNLTTARSTHRAKEIGVRKVMGSLRTALVGQFLSETILMTAIGVVLAVSIASAALPWFNELTGRNIIMPWANPLFWLSLIGGTGLVGLLAGSYPAFFLSAFDIIKVLKGNKTGQAKHSGLRSALVVFQFATAIVLIIATVLVYNQLDFIQNKKLGFRKEQVVVVQDAYALQNNVQAFKQKMLDHPAIESATVSSYLPTPSSRSNSTYNATREFRQDNAVNMGQWTVDHDYLTTLGMELVTGRFFDEARPADSSAIILNEEAAKQFGFLNDPIGKKVYTFDGSPQGKPSPEDFVEYTVIGVVKDFHWESLRENIGALGLHLGNSAGLISFQYDAKDSKEVIAALENNWKSMAPAQPFSYTFLDDSFAEMYETEQQIGTIALVFAFLAILVSCLGLFGLASFMAEQRTKEIGIRKVLGANAGDIVGLLSKDFIKLVLIALVIATPLAIWGMNQWLQDFVYRIQVSWWVFAVAGLSAVLIAVLSVSYQSIRAALSNPVDSLRSE